MSMSTEIKDENMENNHYFIAKNIAGELYDFNHKCSKINADILPGMICFLAKEGYVIAAFSEKLIEVIYRDDFADSIESSHEVESISTSKRPPYDYDCLLDKMRESLRSDE